MVYLRRISLLPYVACMFVLQDRPRLTGPRADQNRHLCSIRSLCWVTPGQEIRERGQHLCNICSSLHSSIFACSSKPQRHVSSGHLPSLLVEHSMAVSMSRRSSEDGYYPRLAKHRRSRRPASRPSAKDLRRRVTPPSNPIEPNLEVYAA